jgi:hypothetical protein
MPTNLGRDVEGAVWDVDVADDEDEERHDCAVADARLEGTGEKMIR